MKDPYQVIKSRYITEKAQTLTSLQNRKSNKSLSKFDCPKYVFLVEKNANKKMIAQALESIYQEKKIKVKKVNTIFVKGKSKRKGKGRPGMSSSFKKAIVTLEREDEI